MVVRRRLLFLASFGLPLATLPVIALAQTKIRRIGVLSGGAQPASLESSAFGAILQGMRELRYVEGRDFVMEWRFAAGNYDRFAEFLAEFVRMNVDIILVLNTRGCTRGATCDQDSSHCACGDQRPAG